MAKYKITLFDIATQEPETSFVSEAMPYPGLVYNDDGWEWEVLQVWLHIRSTESPAARMNAPHLVDVKVKKIDGFFTVMGE